MKTTSRSGSQQTAPAEKSVGVIFFQGELIMKTVKRILAVLFIIVIAVVIGYLVYTAKHIPTEAVYEAAESIIY